MMDYLVADIQIKTFIITMLTIGITPLLLACVWVAPKLLSKLVFIGLLGFSYSLLWYAIKSAQDYYTLIQL